MSKTKSIPKQEEVKKKSIFKDVLNLVCSNTYCNKQFESTRNLEKTTKCPECGTEIKT